MKKDIEWLKEQLFEKAWEENLSEYLIQLDSVYELLDQLDEPEREETEVKKDLIDRLHEKREKAMKLWKESEQNDMMLVAQYQEGRTKGLENAIKIVANFLDEVETDKIIELKQEAIELENELQNLDSYTRDLQVYYKEEIKSLEYELFMQKQIVKKRKKNHFYWFTAKKTPLVSDVSYVSKDNNLYGFKQTPSYTFHLHHDLRFITHCSLDDLIESFR